MAKKAFADPRGGHTRLYWALQDSMAWRALDWSAIALYLAMRRKLLSTNNGNIEATISTLRHAGFKNPTTLSKGLRALETVGLIAKTRQGAIAKGQKICNLFRFTDEAVFAQPKQGIEATKATNEWMAFKTLSEAEHAIAQAHAAVVGTKVKKASKNKLGLQKMYRSSTENVLIANFSNTDSGVGSAHQEQKMVPLKTEKSRRKPHGA